MKKLGFVQTISDPYIYVKFNNNDLFFIAVYVDELLLFSRSKSEIEQVKNLLKFEFKVTDFGEVKYFLGVHVTHDSDKGTIFLNQRAYAENVLRRFGLSEANSVKSPMDPNVKFLQCNDDSKLCDIVLYQSIIGSLIYLSSKTRPDIAYSVNKLARYCSKPSVDNLLAVKRVLRYVKGTLNYGLLYSKSKDNLIECVGYSDADWAGDNDDRKSTSGYSFHMSGASISWNSSKQTCVALSTAEAEYVALSNATQEAMWLKTLLKELNFDSCSPMTLFGDNTAAIRISNDAQCSRKTKHIDIKFNYVRDKVLSKDICLEFCKSEDMIADGLTKALTHDKFVKFRELLGVVSIQ